MTTRKPYAVVKVVDGHQAAGYYWHKHQTSPVDCGYDRKAREYQQAGNRETEVSRHATRAEADADAARRNAGNSTPGITYRAEHYDD